MAEWDGLKEYVKASDSDDDFLSDCWEEAIELVGNHVGGRDAEKRIAAVELIPSSVIARAYLEVGSELFHRRAAPNGISQFASPDGTPVRVARDPMVGAYPILAPYMPPGFA